MTYYTIYDDKNTTATLVSSLRRVSEITGITRNSLWGYFYRGTAKQPIRLMFQRYPFTIIKADSLEKQLPRGNNAFGLGTKK